MSLQARQISKAYGVQRVLDKLTLTVDAGEVVCLLGPNGAGKDHADSHPQRTAKTGLRRDPLGQGGRKQQRFKAAPKHWSHLASTFFV